VRFIVLTVIVSAVLAAASAPASMAQSSAPYRMLATKTVGGDGTFDYVYADVPGRRLYVPRLGPAGVMSVFDLDTLERVGTIPNTSRHGAAVDQKTHHAFGSSNPVTMWDSASLQTIKTIDVQGRPDRIAADPFNGRIYVISHSAPNATVIDAADGSVLGTIDLGGAPEEAVSDGNGRVYINVEDKGNIAVVDAKTMTVTAHYDLGGKGGTCAGLALDRKNNVLFATCRDPQAMVVVNAGDGKILATLPIGSFPDGAAFNPNTMEAFSSNRDGTLTIVKEESPTKFSAEQTLQTKVGAKTLALDTKTNRLFLITADFASPPAAAPGQPASRPQMVPGTFSILMVGK
jgi:DNA-binding beta-propeller fold protein YncE